MSKRSSFLFMFLFFTALPGYVSVCVSAPLMVDKNLFAQDRKPPSPETAAAAPQQNSAVVPPKAIQLDGIMVRGNTKRALLRIKGQSNPKDKAKLESPFITVQEGEKVSDYQVTKIGLRSISLEKAGQTFDVNLYAEGKVLPPMQAAPPPQAPPPPAGAQAGQPPPPPGPPDAANAAQRGNAPPQPKRFQRVDGRNEPLPGAGAPSMAGAQPMDDQNAGRGGNMTEDDGGDAEDFEGDDTQ